MATDLTPVIQQAASDPAAAANDGQSATARPLPDLIAADAYLKGTSQTADPLGPKSGWGLVRVARAIPGGPTD